MGPNRNHSASAPRDGANVGRVGADQRSESPDRAAADDERKALTTLQAMSAMVGCSLHQLDGGGYMICRWGLTRELSDLRTVGDFLRRLGSAR